MSELTSYYYYEDRIITPATHQYRVYHADEADKVIADLEERHKKEVGQLLMKIAGLEKLVETADKFVKPKGGFTVKDISFDGVKLEGLEKEGV